MDVEGVTQDESEQAHFKKIVHSFKCYELFASKRVAKSLNYFHELSNAHKDYLPDFEDNCKNLLKCIEHNGEFIEIMLKDVEKMFENSNELANINDENSTANSLSKLGPDIDKVCTTLKQIVRDWSIEGAQERDACYNPILNELKNLYFNQESNKDLGEICVLVPGSGLGRLAFEIASLGLRCEGNELSVHMLIASNFILNKCEHVNQYKIFPYVNSWSNNLSFDNQSRSISFPDVSPLDFLDNLSNFSMAAGDFLDIYNKRDTAHNVIDYIEKIWYILKPGGYWINFGPLLYHFSDSPNEKSIELSFEQIRNVIHKMGFRVLKEETNKESKYLENKKSMLRYTYNCVFFVVQKPM